MIDHIYLLMGSNLGDRSKNLAECIKELEKEVGTIQNVSSVYETAAWGITEQNSFLNQALELSSSLSPEQMLRKFELIEQRLGRKRTMKWGPRIIDIDILYYNDIILATPTIQIPHREIQNRRFAIEPMIELNREFSHPVYNLSQDELLKQCEDQLEVQKLI